MLSLSKIEIMKNLYVLTILGSLLLLSCTKQLSEEEQLQEDIAIIEKYLSDNQLDAERTASGLHYIVTNMGSEEQVFSTSTVTVRYKGYFVDGQVFDESDAFTTKLTQVIQGWTEGIPKFRNGGEGVLLIPSYLGYGPNGGGSIPGNTVLIFDVKVLDVEN